MKTRVFYGIALAAIVLVAACGPSEKAIEKAGKRIEALKAKGVPDSSLSDAVVTLDQTKGCTKRNEHAKAAQSYDATLKLVAQAEAMYSEKTKALKPAIDELNLAVQAGRQELSGMALNRLDSLVRKADSFAGAGWILQQEGSLRAAADLIPVLKDKIKLSKQLMPELPGEWICTQQTKSAVDKSINAAEDKIFTIYPDKKIQYIERKKGQSGPKLKEDWEFISSGTWDMLGDTIYFFINRFKVARENFDEKFTENGKDTWKRTAHPTYDSTITDGSQDRYIAYTDLKIDFKQTKKF
jgi:hypothetical protein